MGGPTLCITGRDEGVSEILEGGGRSNSVYNRKG